MERINERMKNHIINIFPDTQIWGCSCGEEGNDDQSRINHAGGHYIQQNHELGTWRCLCGAHGPDRISSYNHLEEIETGILAFRRAPAEPEVKKKTITKYMLCRSKDVDRFVLEVSRYLTHGEWKAQGGVNTFDLGNGEILYTQALIGTKEVE